MLTRWNDIDRTFAAMDELRRRMDRLWDDYEGGGGWPELFEGARAYPPLNLLDAGASLVVKAEVPGLVEKDVEISIDQDVLTMKGERRADAPEGYSVHRQERRPARFSRSFALPCKVDPEKTSASIKDGILTVTLPKAPEARPRQIAVVAQG